MKKARSEEPTCEVTLSLLSDFAEGELEHKQARVVERHLKSCARCRAEAVLVAGIVGKLNELEPYPIPVDIARRVVVSLRAQKKQTFVRPGLWERIAASLAPQRGLVAVASLACVLLLVLVPLIQNPSSAPSMAQLERPVQGRLGGLLLSAGNVQIDDITHSSDGLTQEMLKIGTRIALCPDSTALLNFQDGSSVIAGDGAIVRVGQDGLDLEFGRLELSMTPNGIGFTVRTPQAEVVVRGTVYSVHVGDEGTQVRVKRGKVSVESSSTGEQVLLRGGEQVSIDDKGILTRSSSTAAQEAGQSEDTRLGASDDS